MSEWCEWVSEWGWVSECCQNHGWLVNTSPSPAVSLLQPSSCLWHCHQVGRCDHLGSSHLKIDQSPGPCQACCWHFHILHSSHGARSWASPTRDVCALGILRPLLDLGLRPRPTRVLHTFHTSSGVDLLEWRLGHLQQSHQSFSLRCSFRPHFWFLAVTVHTVQLNSVLVHGLKKIPEAFPMLECHVTTLWWMQLSWHDIHFWKQNGIAVSASLKLCVNWDNVHGKCWLGPMHQLNCSFSHTKDRGNN